MADNTGNVAAVAEEVKQRGKPAGPGAIKCEVERYGEFQKIWNETVDDGKKIDVVVKNKDGSTKIEQVGGMTVCILIALRTAGIANEHTDTAQVRAFSSKVKDAGFELRQFSQRLDRKKIVINWMQSKTPGEAFQKCIDQGVFGEEEGADDEEKAKWRKDKLQSHRAVVVQLRESGVALKKMGRTRTGKIDAQKFAKIWNDCDSIAEVKDALIKAGLCDESVKLSAIRAKAGTLRKGTHEKNEDGTDKVEWKVAPIEMKKLRANEGLDELKKLAAMLADGADVSALEEKEEDDEEEEEETEEEDDDEDAEPVAEDAVDDAFGGFGGK